jgi:hypothetical protein
MFSSVSPDYEENLKEELFGCFKYVGIPFDVLDRMPTRDRKYYIMRHNRSVEEENARMKHEMGEHSNTNDVDIDAYTKLEQSNIKNLNR